MGGRGFVIYLSVNIFMPMLEEMTHFQKRLLSACGIIIGIVLLYVIVCAINPFYAYPVSFVLLLTFYIVARYLFRKGKLIITCGGYDMGLMIVSSLAIFIGGLCLDGKSSHDMGTILSILGLIALGVSIVLSINKNLGDPLMVLVSVLAKLAISIFFVFILCVAFILIIYSIMPIDNKKDFNVWGWLDHLKSFLIME